MSKFYKVWISLKGLFQLFRYEMNNCRYFIVFLKIYVSFLGNLNISLGNFQFLKSIIVM